MAEMMGYSAEDQGILDKIHSKLNRGEQVEQQKAAPPLPTPATPPNQPLNLDDPNPQPADQPAEGVAPVEGQPAEGQTAEGEAQPETEAIAPALFKVEITGDDGKPLEVDVDFNERKSGYLRHADYTRKTQALAKERAVIPQKLAESEKAVTKARTQFGQALQHLQALAINAAAPELQGVDWNRLAVENPGEHVRLTQRANHLNATLAQIRNMQQRVEQQATAAQTKAKQEAAVAARETLNREIPGGWNDDLYAKIAKGAVNHYGYTQEEFLDFTDARTILMANDALKYRDLIAGKSLTQQKVAQAPQLAVKPGATPTATEKRQSVVDKARDAARKSGSIDDALALMQAKRARQVR